MKKGNREYRHKRIRARIKGTASVPRVCVYKSGLNIYVQFINDEKGHTLAALDSRKIKSGKKGKVISAKEVGKLAAEKALKKNVKKIVFDRNGYKYHGRVKALADGLREGGLKF